MQLNRSRTMSRRLAVAAAASVVLFLSSGGPRPAAALAAQPATAPAEAASAAPVAAFVVVAVDQSTPRGALKVLTQALDMGDVEAIRRVLLAESPGQEAWADAMVEMSQATGRLQKQAVATYGAEGARALVGDTANATMLAMAQLDTFTEELDDAGAVANVRSGFADERPMVVKKVDGAWRVPIDSFTGGAPAEELEPVAGRLKRQAAAIAAVVDDIAAGKLATPEAAAEALQRRQVEAVMQPPPPQPQAPTTAPATSPAETG